MVRSDGGGQSPAPEKARLATNASAPPDAPPERIKIPRSITMAPMIGPRRRLAATPPPSLSPRPEFTTPPTRPSIERARARRRANPTAVMDSSLPAERTEATSSAIVCMTCEPHAIVTTARSPTGIRRLVPAQSTHPQTVPTDIGTIHGRHRPFSAASIDPARKRLRDGGRIPTIPRTNRLANPSSRRLGQPGGYR